MNCSSSFPTSSLDKLFNFGIALWGVIIFLVSTYIRVRPGETVPEIDLLVISQILTCFLGGCIGVFLILKHPRFGFGAKALLFLIAVTGLSTLFSSHPKIVFGYWVLFSGAGLLTIGLVQSAPTIESLNRIESVLLLVLTIILLKDTITGLYLPNLLEIRQSLGGTFRLGMGVTHANKISFMAAIAFFVSLKNDNLKSSILVWLARLIFIFIIVFSRTRSSMLCLVLGSVLWLFFNTQITRSSKFYLKFAIPCIFIALTSGALLALSFNMPGISEAFAFINRSQDADSLWSITGRTDIWRYAIERLYDDNYTFLFGHGYGMSRLILNEGPRAFFYAFHAHNAYIEALVSEGLLGLIGLLLFTVYGITWLTRYSTLIKYFSEEYVLRSICIVSIILFNSMTESYLTMKLNAVIIIYILYVLSLDKKRYLEQKPDF